MRLLKGWVAASALAACTVLPPPAAAGWRGTPWGMQFDEVVAALSAAAKPNPDRTLDVDGLRAALVAPVAPFRGRTIPFTAVFMFDPENKLQVVTLKPIGEAACPVVVQALDDDHGAPEGEADMGQVKTLRWDDEQNNNLVVFADFGPGDCTVQYSKLPPTQPDGKGL